MTTGVVMSIFKEQYDKMKEELRWLKCLEDAGVDNWQGIDHAHELFNGEE